MRLQLNNEDWGGLLFVTPLVTNPTVNFQPQGRDTRTRQFIDNASYVAGNHSFQFGGSLQQIRVKNYSNFTRFPTVNFGFSAAAPASVQLTAAQFPGGIAARGPRQRKYAGLLPRRHDLFRRPDLSGDEQGLGLRPPGPQSAQLRPRQLCGLHSGQLALPAQPDAAPGSQVGVFQPAPGRG